MRDRQHLHKVAILLAGLLLFSCSQKAEEGTTPSTDSDILSIMIEEMDPAADGIWQSAGWIITEEGEVENIEILKSPGAAFDEEVKRTLATWRFKPATLDGEPVDIERVNYLLRGVHIPAGEHTLRMRFDPARHSLSLWLSGLSTLLVYGGTFLLLGLAWRRRQGEAAA